MYPPFLILLVILAQRLFLLHENDEERVKNGGDSALQLSDWSGLESCSKPELNLSRIERCGRQEVGLRRDIACRVHRRRRIHARDIGVIQRVDKFREEIHFE